tara:strand:- start:2670 stop:3014 length:345 start_codon:yes stop_codon:yes gene_type:complete
MPKANIMTHKQLQNNLEVLLNPNTKVNKKIDVTGLDRLYIEEEFTLENGMTFSVSFCYHPAWEDSYEKESGGNYIEDFELYFIDYSDCYGDGYEIELTDSQEERVKHLLIENNN